jgi:CRP-like cAMP-binding protein
VKILVYKKPTSSGEVIMGTLQAPDELKSQLLAIGTRTHSTHGTFLFHRGRPVTGIFLILSGAVRLGLERDVEAFPARKAGAGAVLGLPAALANAPYSLSAQVVEDAELVYVSREKLLDLLRERNHLSMLVIEILTEELTHTRAALELVRIPAGSRAS